MSLLIEDITGHINLDANPSERAIRPVTLGRKNALFPAARAAPAGGQSLRH
nr:IS66 family transposase [Acetobacter sacchari]